MTPRVSRLSGRLNELTLNGYNEYTFNKKRKSSYYSEPEEFQDTEKVVFPRVPYNTPETLSSTDSSPMISPRNETLPALEKTYWVL